MITNQLLYQLSYTGMGLFSNEDRRKKEVAEEVGFEPTVGSHLRRFSRPVP